LAAYWYTHHFPESFDVIAAHTPASVWLRTDGDVSLDRVMAALRPFGTRPVVVKDFIMHDVCATGCILIVAQHRNR
jgi:hypothetical protein